MTQLPYYMQHYNLEYSLHLDCVRVNFYFILVILKHFSKSWNNTFLRNRFILHLFWVININWASSSVLQLFYSSAVSQDYFLFISRPAVVRTKIRHWLSRHVWWPKSKQIPSIDGWKTSYLLLLAELDFEELLPNCLNQDCLAKSCRLAGSSGSNKVFAW